MTSAGPRRHVPSVGHTFGATRRRSPVQQRDYLSRQLRRLLAALARALGKLETKDLGAARDAVVDAYASLPGFDPKLLEMLSTKTVAEMLRENELVRALARIRGTEALLLEAEGDGQRAVHAADQALLLYQQVGFGTRDEDTAMAARLLACIDRLEST